MTDCHGGRNLKSIAFHHERKGGSPASDPCSTLLFFNHPSRRIDILVKERLMLEAPLPPGYDTIASRLANEGIPVNVIARGLEVPAADVRVSLDESLASGRITEMPAADWPPTARRADHLPPHIAAARDADLVTSFMRAFKLTKLMASFMLVLVKREEADKTTLHRVIEAQRAARVNRPDTSEETNPKMVDVMVCNLRKKLRPFGLTINTLWGRGYYLDAQDRQRVLALVEREVDVQAANDNQAPAVRAA